MTTFYIISGVAFVTVVVLGIVGLTIKDKKK